LRGEVGATLQRQQIQIKKNGGQWPRPVVIDATQESSRVPTKHATVAKDTTSLIRTTGIGYDFLIVVLNPRSLRKGEERRGEERRGEERRGEERRGEEKRREKSRLFIRIRMERWFQMDCNEIQVAFYLQVHFFKAYRRLIILGQ
jgi:hypothetical protein